MARTVLLNNVDHQALRVITRRSAALGDDIMSALTFPAEFRSLQAHYPIVFHRTPDSGDFQPLALLGFEPGQNLFLSETGWDADVLPLMVEREPFLIGRAGSELQMHIDLDSPRLSTSQGEPLFLPYGGSSEFLERMNSVLLAIHQGLQGTPAFVAALLEYGLLEPFVFDIERGGGTTQRLAGFHTVHEERLAALDGAALERLHRAGWLEPVYMVIASLSNLPALAQRQARRAAGGTAHEAPQGA